MQKVHSRFKDNLGIPKGKPAMTFQTVFKKRACGSFATLYSDGNSKETLKGNLKRNFNGSLFGHCRYSSSLVLEIAIDMGPRMMPGAAA